MYIAPWLCLYFLKDVFTCAVCQAQCVSSAIDNMTSTRVTIANHFVAVEFSRTPRSSARRARERAPRTRMWARLSSFCFALSAGSDSTASTLKALLDFPEPECVSAGAGGEEDPPHA